jgi:hypothetical protein
MEAHWSEWLLQWKYFQNLEKLDPSELHIIMHKSIRYQADQKSDTSEHTWSLVFIVSIGYKAVSTTTPAAPPAIEPSGIGKGTSRKCSTMNDKNYIHNMA